MARRIDPLHDFAVGACIMRFCIGLFFGALLDVMIVGVWAFFYRMRRPEVISLRTFAWLLGCLPVVWGVLSIFWLEPMTEFVRSSWEEGPTILLRFCPSWLRYWRWKS